jgi:hypothetical protein
MWVPIVNINPTVLTTVPKQTLSHIKSCRPTANYSEPKGFRVPDFVLILNVLLVVGIVISCVEKTLLSILDHLLIEDLLFLSLLRFILSGVLRELP